MELDGRESRSLFHHPKQLVAARLQRLCVCRAIVACSEIIPAFVAPPSIIPPSSSSSSTTVKCSHFLLHISPARLCWSVSTETRSGGREPPPFDNQTAAELSALRAMLPPQTAGIVRRASMEQERRLSLFGEQWNSSPQLLNSLAVTLQHGGK